MCDPSNFCLSLSMNWFIERVREQENMIKRERENDSNVQCFLMINDRNGRCYYSLLTLIFFCSVIPLIPENKRSLFLFAKAIAIAPIYFAFNNINLAKVLYEIRGNIFTV